MFSISQIPVRKIMDRNALSVEAGVSLKSAAKIMLEHKLGCLVVVKGPKPIGILTERDFVRLVQRDGEGLPHNQTVGDACGSKLVTVSPNTRFLKAFNMINSYGYKQLPVVEKGVLKGLLTWRQMLTYSRNSLIDLLEKNRNLNLQANKDELTGLYNKRYFRQVARKEFEKSSRFGVRTSLIFLDLDNFKQINDTHTHAAGDLVLQELGKFFLSNLRPDDIAFRFGGEEFLILAGSKTSPEAALNAHSLRSKIKELVFRYNKVSLKLTISAGVASFYGAKDVKQAVDRADRALYKAKNLGRDRVCRWKDSKGTAIEVPEPVVV